MAQGGALDAAQRARITAACCASQEQLREAVAALAAVAGMRAIERTGGFSRAWRDLQALGAHGSLAPRHVAAAGHTLLDQAGRSDTISCASVVTGGPQTLPEQT